MPITEKEWERGKKAPITIIDENKVYVIFSDGEVDTTYVRDPSNWERRIKKEEDLSSHGGNTKV